MNCDFLLLFFIESPIRKQDDAQKFKNPQFDTNHDVRLAKCPNRHHNWLLN